MNDHIILAVHVTDRLEKALEVQKILSEYGALIKTRLGLHETDGSAGAKTGLLVLEMIDKKDEINTFSAKLTAIDGIEVKSIIFNH